MTKRVYFRADASSKVGLGHLTRCLALASMLKDYFDCTFILHESSEVGFLMVSQKNYKSISVAQNDLFKEAQEVASIIGESDIIVFDGYQFSEEYLRVFKTSGVSVVCIDDFLKFLPSADVIINHAVGLSERVNSGLENTKLCLGERFAMLRPAFIKKAKKEREILKVENVFVCFGGADYFNVTLKVLKALCGVSAPIHVHLVLASTFPFKQEVISFLDEVSLNVTVYHNIGEEEMAEVMSSCEIAVAPTSGLSYEICAVGMGYLGGYFIDNQINIYDGFLSKGCLVGVGDFNTISELEFQRLFSDLVTNISKVREVVSQQKKLVDGQSDANILKIFLLL